MNLLRLRCVEQVRTPVQFMALVEWFLKLAALVERVPVVPQMPCRLTTAAWPRVCPSKQPPQERCARPAATAPSHLSIKQQTSPFGAARQKMVLETRDKSQIFTAYVYM